MRPPLRALRNVRAILAGIAVAAPLLLLPLASAPLAPPASARAAACDYAFPRVRAWQLAQAEQAALATQPAVAPGAGASSLLGLAGPSC
ncbi:MAG: hypothetical protein ACKOWF_18180 [Chloroflexota bacterium]